MSYQVYDDENVMFCAGVEVIKYPNNVFPLIIIQKNYEFVVTNKEIIIYNVNAK